MATIQNYDYLGTASFPTTRKKSLAILCHIWFISYWDPTLYFILPYENNNLWVEIFQETNGNEHLHVRHQKPQETSILCYERIGVALSVIVGINFNQRIQIQSKREEWKIRSSKEQKNKGTVDNQENK